ncbi:hypothetical protein SK128_019461 [Halocaridina rubra]|uniref:Uncharacterized protein n=1 Tax=Halocaridina rubra TaxID=373956 RepID=A0AAN8X980_HALRR
MIKGIAAVMLIMSIFLPKAYSIQCYVGLPGLEAIQDCAGSCVKMVSNLDGVSSVAYSCLDTGKVEGDTHVYYCHGNLCNHSTTSSLTFALIFLPFLCFFVYL